MENNSNKKKSFYVKCLQLLLTENIECNWPNMYWVPPPKTTLEKILDKEL